MLHRRLRRLFGGGLGDRIAEPAAKRLAQALADVPNRAQIESIKSPNSTVAPRELRWDNPRVDLVIDDSFAHAGDEGGLLNGKVAFSELGHGHPIKHPRSRMS